MWKALREGQCSACVLFFLIAIAAVAYWCVEPFIRPALLNDLLDGPLMVVSFVAGTVYLSWALFNCHEVIDRAFVLRVGICLAWFGNGLWRLSRFLYSEGVLHGPVGAHDPWRGFMIELMLIAGIMHILAIDMEGSQPRLSMVAIAAVAVISGLVPMLIMARIL